jgi:hypothetical protein
MVSVKATLTGINHGCCLWEYKSANFAHRLI